MSVEQSLSSSCTRTQCAQSQEDATEELALECVTQSPGNVGTVTRRSLSDWFQTTLWRAPQIWLWTACFLDDLKQARQCFHFLIWKMGSFQLLLKVRGNNAISGILLSTPYNFSSASAAFDQDRKFGVLEVDLSSLSALLISFLWMVLSDLDDKRHQVKCSAWWFPGWED